MYRNLLFCFCLLLAPIGTATAQNNKPAAREPAAKALSGMSIVGNDEAPKALYIVPWKSSELGAETDLSKTFTDNAVPVDRDVFMRQLDFYGLSTKK